MFMNLLAHVLARPAVADWLIQRAKRTPYIHVKGADGSIYMERYWLFNPYPPGDERSWWGSLLPSIRIQHILREDLDEHLHDHPWNARTFILRNWYREEREARDCPMRCPTHFWFRTQGHTARIRYGEYHRICEVAPGGMWTMFVTGKRRGTWGFNVDGKKVPWRVYLGIEKGESK